jgi:hypothetical protein
MNKLLTNIENIAKLSGFDGNIDNDSINPFIFMAESTEIKRVLGNPLYLKIKTDFNNDSLQNEYLALFNDYIELILSYYTCSFYLQLGIIKVSQNGAYLVTPERTQQSSEELVKMADKYEKLALGLEIKMQEHLEELNLPERPSNSRIKVKTSLNWIKPEKFDNEYNHDKCRPTQHGTR